MKLVNAQLEGVIEALADVSQNRLPGPIALQISRSKRAVAEAFGDITEARDTLIKAHAPKDAEAITPEDDGWDEFTKAFVEMLNEETEIDAKPIDIDELTANGASFKPDSLGLLEYVGLLKD